MLVPISAAGVHDHPTSSPLARKELSTLLMESKSKQMTVTLIPARVSRHAGMQGLARDTHTHAYLRVRAFLYSNKALDTFYLYFFYNIFSK